MRPDAIRHKGLRVTIDDTAFERYRRSPNAKTTLLRLFLGTLIVVLLWGATTAAVLFGGTYAYFAWQASAVPPADGVMQGFLASPIGILSALASFAGIWIGLWIAMRWVHGEPLIGAARRQPPRVVAGLP